MANPIDILRSLSAQRYAPDRSQDLQDLLNYDDLADEEEKNVDTERLFGRPTLTPTTGPLPAGLTPRGPALGLSYASGATPRDVEGIRSNIEDQFGQQAQDVAKFNEANQQAMQQGFGGTTDIMKGVSGEDEQGKPLAGQYVARGPELQPAQQMARYQQQAELQKLFMPLQVEQAKTQGALALQAGQYDQVRRLLQARLQQGQQPQGAAPTGLSQTKDVAANAPYNGITDLLGAYKDRVLGGLFATPQTKMQQEGAYKTLSSFTGLLPGVRGIQMGLSALKEHLDNYGHESPMASYLRLNNLRPVYQEAMTSMNDPNELLKMSPEGKMTIAQDPQVLIRAKQALAIAQKLNEDQIHEMEKLYPGIQNGLVGQGQPGAAAPPGASAAGRPSKYKRIF
jgi:hypothetical protein